MAKGSILITGANGGLGSALVSQLVQSSHGQTHHGIYTVRNPATAHDLHAALKQAPATHTFDVVALDLGSLSKIRAAAKDINARVRAGTLPPLRALVLNAAFQEANARTLRPQTYTGDGLEAAFAVNYLANFLLVLLLLESLDRERGRVVMISSSCHDAYSPHNMDFFKGDQYKVMYKDTQSLAKGVEYKAGDGFNAGMRRYGASKLLLVMFMYELQRRLDNDEALSKISVLSIDPGGMGGTGIMRRGPWWMRFLMDFVLPLLQDVISYLAPRGPIRSTKKSARDVLRACVDEGGVLGRAPRALFLDGDRSAESSEESRDVAKQKTLWGDSLELAAIEDGDTVLTNWR